MSIRICPAEHWHIKDSYKAPSSKLVSFSRNTSLELLFPKMTGLKLHDKEAYVIRLLEVDEDRVAEKWFNEHRDLVFLNDSLDCSISLGMNMSAPGEQTALGQLEHLAKEHNDSAAQSAIYDLLENKMGALDFYNDPNAYVAAVPKGTNAASSLPESLAAQLAQKTSRKCLVSNICWANKTQSLQNTSVTSKSGILSSSGFVFTPPPNFAGANVILIDDMYQSGETMKFVSINLKLAGARNVYGVTVVKSLRNTDNTSSS